jgi:hypothetical protein
VRSKGTVHALEFAWKMHYLVYLEVCVYAKNREKKELDRDLSCDAKRDRQANDFFR